MSEETLGNVAELEKLTEKTEHLQMNDKETDGNCAHPMSSPVEEKKEVSWIKNNSFYIKPPKLPKN